MLEFRLLGQFDVRADGTPLVIPSRLLQSLLAYLLVHHTTTHRREKLAGVFWPDTSETKARGNLRQSLWRLRKALDATSLPHSDLLLSDDLSVGIDPQTTYWLDVAQFEAVSNHPSTDHVLCPLDLYQGELLPDFYDEWVALERVRLHALFEQQVERLLEQLCADRRWKEALTWAERWIALGRSPEPAYRALMLSQSALGNRSQVVAVFERCAAALKADLAVEPSEETRGLYEQLLKDEGGMQKAEGISSSFTPALPRTPLGAGGVAGGAGVLHHPSFVLPPPSFSDKAPYKGLQYFDEEDADHFFGRERLVAILLGHLAEHHWLTVVGDSGSGKSSLVRAGLVPALKNGNCSTPGTLSRRWTIHVLTPTAHPLEALAIQLTRDAQSAMAAITLIDDLARDARTLRIYSGKAMHDANQILLVIDQFEELFTLCREERERQRFIDNLLLATAPELDRPISVVVALRADFYARFAAYTNLREALSRRQEYIGPMNADELRSVIQGPAERGGWELEPGLVELMLRDVGNEPGALPLLSHALLEIWKRRDGQRLTLAGYSECGGVHGAIAQTAERVYLRLSVEGQAIARRIFLKLTELGEGTEDTRRRVSLGELVPNPADAPRVQAVLQTLAEARLVTLGEDAVEVAHEALIREWPTLREWLNQNRDGLRLHRQLTEAAQAWEKMNRDAGELYRGVRLAQAMEWAKAQPAELHPLELEFLDAARAWQEREETEREAQRQRELAAAQRLADVQTHNARQLRQRAFFLAGASLVAVVLAIIAVAFGQQSNQNAMRAENERSLAFARELSANAVNNLNLDPERSILLALRAVSVSNAGGRPGLREAEEALHRAVQASRVRLVLRGHTVGLYDIAYSPDGKRLATAGGDKTVKLWEVATGKEVLTLRGHSNIVYRVAFSPDGTRLATASFDGTANIWDAESGKLLLTLRGHTNYVDGIAFTPDGKRLATASLDGTARVWDALTGRELLTLNAHPEGLSSVAFSPDGKRLATGSWAGEVEHTAKVWDAVTGNLLLTLRGHASTLYDIAFSPDGKRLTTASTDGTARIWDSASGQQLLILFVHSGVLQVTFSPDPAGTRLATADGDGTAKVWDAMTGELLANVAGHTATVSGVSFSPDGMRIATASHDATARVWDISPASSGEGLMIVGNGDSLLDLAYSPDGRRIATAGRDKTARIWDSGTGKELDTLTGHSGMVRSVAFSPDGTRLATTGVDQTLKVWDMATGNPLLNLSTSSFVSLQGPQVVFSPDGQWMASGAAGGTTQVWDAATGKGLLTLCCHSSSFVRGVAFSPDGTLLATGGFDNLVKVWDLATGKEMLTLAGHTAGIWAVAFSPDSRLIATASTDGTAKLWELDGKELVTFSGHSGTVNDIAFSPDGIHIATASSDGTVKVWDVPTASARGEQPLTLYNPGSAMFHGVAFSPDGKRLAASGADGNVRIYALALEDIIAIAKSRLTRNWTLDECLKFLHMETCPPE